MDRKTLPVERHRDFLVGTFYPVLFYSSTGMKWAHSALMDHYKSPGQQRSGSLSKLSVVTLMPGLLLSVSGLSVSLPVLLRMHWAAAAEIHHLLLAPSELRGWGPCLHDARLLSSAQCRDDLWGCRYPCLWNTQCDAGKRLLEVIQCCCLLRLQEFVFGLCLLAATTTPKISTRFKKHPFHIY